LWSLAACGSKDTAQSTPTAQINQTAQTSQAALVAGGPQIVMSADGVHIEYHVHGSGEPAVVLIHGWSCDANYWREQIAALTANYTTVTVDLAGHGASGANRTDWSMENFGEDVAAVVRQIHNPKVVLVGHSMGGLTIPRVGLVAPERVVHLVYVGALAPPVGQSAQQALGVDVAADQPDDALLPPLPDEVCRRLFGNDMTDEQWAQAGEGIVSEPVFLFRDIVTGYPPTIPNTYLGMTQDRPVPPEMAARMMEQLVPNLTFVEVDGGHNIMISQPHTLAAIINRIAAGA
jgi:pimeloyl-ACP methyl ester carboxylesterase